MRKITSLCALFSATVFAVLSGCSASPFSVAAPASAPLATSSSEAAAILFTPGIAADSSESTVAEVNGQCGPHGTVNYGGCGGGRCCSRFGWCGDSPDHCGSGCQRGYGNCW